MQLCREIMIPGGTADERCLAFCLWSLVATLPLSIFLCQSFLFLSSVFALIVYYRHPGILDHKGLPFFWPILFCILTSVVSSLASDNPLYSLKALKKFLLIVIVLFLYSRFLQSEKQIKGLIATLFLSSSASAVLAAIQFPTADLLHRASGFLGHWQTFAGQQMMVIAVLVALLLFLPKYRFYHLGFLLILTAGLIFSETRGSWLGAILAVFLLFWMKDKRLAFALILLALCAFYLLPERVQTRAYSIYSALTDGTIDEPRFNMWQTGLNMIAAHPLLGVGPDRVKDLVSHYGGNPNYQPIYFMHLHNNYLQLAAERGIPGLLAWIWFLTAIVWMIVRNMVKKTFPVGSFPYAFNLGFLGAMISLLIAGVFEFNLGDSEVLMLFLFLCACVVSLNNLFLSKQMGGNASLTEGIQKN